MIKFKLISDTVKAAFIMQSAFCTQIQTRAASSHTACFFVYRIRQGDKFTTNYPINTLVSDYKLDPLFVARAIRGVSLHRMPFATIPKYRTYLLGAGIKI